MICREKKKKKCFTAIYGESLKACFKYFIPESCVSAAINYARVQSDFVFLLLPPLSRISKKINMSDGSSSLPLEAASTTKSQLKDAKLVFEVTLQPASWSVNVASVSDCIN